VFSEDPLIYRETLDLAVIVPELAQALAGRFRTGLLLPAAARLLAPRSASAAGRRWCLLRDGQYVGAIDGLRELAGLWSHELSRLLASRADAAAHRGHPRHSRRRPGRARLPLISRTVSMARRKR